ncbi:hypothetical protein F5Y10DRAFT_263964 [Nemania abortiva]|nr:hypothetical protein F5Y10DRAFT_263964 [Nemania abortiva]
MTDSHYICQVGEDLELVVKQRDHDQSVTQDGGSRPDKPVIMKVSRACIQRYTSLLDATAANHGRQEGARLVIANESIAAVKVWMEALHAQTPQHTNATIQDVWWAIHFGNKYLLGRKEGAELDDEDDEDGLKPAKDMSPLSGWFTGFYNMHKKEFKGKESDGKPRAFSVLAPAYWFDCPQIFHDATRYIAYNTTGHIENTNPTKYHDQYMRGVPDRVLSQLSAARASQRTRLEKWLPTVPATCPDRTDECLDVMVFSHKRSLLITGIKSLFSLADRKRTLNQLLDNLDKYEFSLAKIEPQHPGENINSSWSTKLCHDCTGERLSHEAAKLTSKVLSASERVRENFGGLCLDCMHKFRNGNDDDDYFMHDKRGHHDHSCRVKHGQPTWYFSYMGRKELMLRHQGKRAEERRKKNQELRGKDDGFKRMYDSLPGN